MKVKRKTKNLIRDILYIIIGSFIAAMAINLFIVPYKIAPGGISGIATVIYYLSNNRFPIGMTSLVLNIPMFLFGFKLFGTKFIFRTLFGTVMLSVFIDYTHAFTAYVGKVLGIVSASSPDILLYSIFGGFFMGFGLGLVFKTGATTGGSDLAARLINHYIPHLTMGQLILIVDTIIVIIAGFAFQSFQLALYALITMYISSKLIDAVLEGVNFAKAVFIISDKPDLIAGKIMKDLERGVTGLFGKGMYTGGEKNVLLCIVDRGQIELMKSLVNDVDKNAFIILTEIREVLGNGFKTYE